MVCQGLQKILMWVVTAGHLETLPGLNPEMSLHAVLALVSLWVSFFTLLGPLLTQDVVYNLTVALTQPVTSNLSLRKRRQ